MKTKYVSLEEILRLHFQIIEDFGGSHGVKDEGRLKPVANAPQQILFNQEQYPSLCDKAAVYLRNIIGDHPFVDGNERTALALCGVFLARNGIELKAKPKDLELFTIQVTTDHLDIDKISEWLTAHC